MEDGGIGQFLQRTNFYNLMVCLLLFWMLFKTSIVPFFCFCKGTIFFLFVWGVVCQRAFFSTWLMAKHCLEEEGVLASCYHIDGYLLSDDFHAAEVVGGYGYDDDAVVVLIAFLHLGEVVFYFYEGGVGQVGEEDGFLYARASFLLQVFDYEASHFVVFYVVHHEECHVAGVAFGVVDDVEDFLYTFFDGGYLFDGFAFSRCRGDESGLVLTLLGGGIA